jgi:DNA invertase Pin-like site-specific DNA recombinase
MRTWSNSSNFLLDKRPQKITKYHFFIQIKVVNPMGRRVSIYARYSSDLQSDASIEDQVRALHGKSHIRKLASRGTCYTDAGISGASTLMRPGIQSLLAAAIEMVSLIFFSQKHLTGYHAIRRDIAGIYKRMELCRDQDHNPVRR